MHKFHPAIFREYDIRGCHGVNLFDEDAYAIGRSFAALLDGNAKICVGRDGRNSSPALAQNLIKGLVDSGIKVIDLGLVPSPALYFSVFHLQTDGAIMVTASHNPPQDNGFKFMLGKDAMFGEQIQKLAVSLESQVVSLDGSVTQLDIRQEYINRVLKDLRLTTKSLRIAWDAANGAMGEILDMATSTMLENGQFGADGGHFLINAEIDGDFPAHPADPTLLENNAQLIEALLEDNCDIGFGFDGDGDRLGIIDDKGRMIAGDQILTILARDVLENLPGATIIADMKSSMVFSDEVTRLGGKPVLWKTGHSLIKSKMNELGAPLAGEMSAHFFFADEYYGYDDALYAAIRFLNTMNKTGLKASELLDSLPKTFASSEINLKVKDLEKFKIIANVKAQLLADGASFLDIDGVRVVVCDGWWLLRASNTGAHLVARYESASEAGYDMVKADLQKYIDMIGLSLD